MRWFWQRKKNRAPAPDFGPITPETSFLVVGDIHGCLDLLDDALGRISGADDDMPLVFVGDYVDRGPDSAGVLRRLRALQASRSAPVICLGGNHEQMLLGFLDAPHRHYRPWLRHGGDATLRSYGIEPPAARASDADVETLRARLAKAIGADMQIWLRALPQIWRSGNVWVTHAGADPMVGLEVQDPHALIWGHPEFQTYSRTDGQWVVHGHTIVPSVQCQDGRISVDTGAYRTGRLSLLRVGSGGVDLLD